jgi:BirA family biotin operon repressor/biotin-[acetyl-CoA-carboxylase] ligase
VEDRQPLDVSGLTVALPWTGLRVVESVDSTNTAVAALPAGSVLVAEFQTAGRGRLDRQWQSPPRAGLTLSVHLRPAAPPARWGWLPLMAGLALSEVVPGSALKWPNDLLLDGGKAAGILAAAENGAVVVGVGLNVSTAAEELPPGGTSLRLAGSQAHREEVLQALLDRWGWWYRAWEAAGGDPQRCGLRAAYLTRCATLGQTVTVTGAAPVEGVATDVDPDGRLVVAGVAVAAGDVTHVRPAEPPRQ